MTTPTFAQKVKTWWTPERTAKVTGNKKVLFDPALTAPLLRELLLLNADASMAADSVRKFMQINHMVELLKPRMLELKDRFPVVKILDCGCGNSYLTFLLAWAFQHIWKHPVVIVGIDTNAKVIEQCQARAQRLGFSDLLQFEAISVQDFWAREKADAAQILASEQNTSAGGEGAKAKNRLRFHAVIALHACDTATDDALATALELKADVIAVAPCCQAELASKWRELSGKNFKHALGVVMRSHELRRDVASSFTDAMRLLLLRGSGYETQSMEFVPSAHTPKNRLIVAQRRGNYQDDALKEYLELKEHLGGEGISLEANLPEAARARLTLVSGSL